MHRARRGECARERLFSLAHTTMSKRITPQEAAQRMGLSEFTIARMRQQQRGPAFIRISANRVLYLEDSVQAWIDARTVVPDQAA